MEEMSEIFQRAYSAGHYDEDYALDLYNREIEDNPENFAAYNNRAVCKVKIAIRTKNADLVTNAIAELGQAIKLADDNYPIAEKNINWAKEVLSSFK